MYKSHGLGLHICLGGANPLACFFFPSQRELRLQKSEKELKLFVDNLTGMLKGEVISQKYSRVMLQ